MKNLPTILLFLFIGNLSLKASVPEDPMMLFSIRPGQLIEKSGYKDLNLLDLIPAKELARVPTFFQDLLKDPVKSGLDMDSQVHFFMDYSKELSKFNKGKMVEPAMIGGASISIKNLKVLNEVITNITKFTEEDEGIPAIKSEKHGDLSILTFEDTNEFLVGIGKKEILLIGSNYPQIHSTIKNKKQLKKLPKPNEWMQEQTKSLLNPAEDQDTPESLAHNEKSKDDIKMYMDYKRFMDLATSAETDGPEKEMLDALLNNPAMAVFTNMKLSMGLNFGKGNIRAHYDYILEEDNPFAAAIGDGLAPSLLNVLPSDPALYWSVSSNIKEVKKAIGDVYLPMIKNLVGNEEAEEFNLDSELPIVEMSLNEVLSIFEGDMVFYLKDVVKTPGPIPLPQADFVLGMTLENRELFDQLLNTLTSPKKPDAPKPNIEQILGAVGLALTRKDDSVFLSHAKYGREIEAGKSLNPVEGEHKDRLASNYTNGYINFGRVLTIIDAWVPEGEKGKANSEYNQAMEFFRKLEAITFSQNKNLSAEMEVSFVNKEKNSLRVFTEFLKKVASDKISEVSEKPTKKEPKDKPAEKPKPEKKPEPEKPKSALVPTPPPPLPGSIPYQIPTSKKLDLNDDGYFQKYLATFRGDLSEDEKKLVGRWKGTNDSTGKNEWEILQRKDRSFSLAIRSMERDQEWESVPILHGAWRIDGGRLLYVVLQVENMHLSLSEIEISSEKVEKLTRKIFVTKGEEDSGQSFTSQQERVKRFEGPRMWNYNNPENLKNFTFHIPPPGEQ